MNLLFAFLRHLDHPIKSKLIAIKPRGIKAKVWLMISEQANGNVDYEKETIIKETAITSAHLDKISSELLTLSYQVIFGTDILSLLTFLSKRVVYVKLFFRELERQTKSMSPAGDIDIQCNMIRQCFRMIHTNMPLSSRHKLASIKLAKKYLSLHKGLTKAEARFYTDTMLLYERMEELFAASEIKENMAQIEKELEALGSPSPDYNSDIVFEYYFTKIYFYHATEQILAAFDTARESLISLSRYKGDRNELNMFTIKLKTNEFRYYLSSFDESYRGYHTLVNDPKMNIVADRSYHLTKYIQVALITDHLREVYTIVQSRLIELGDKVEHLIIIRDAITFAKYYLLAGDYDQAFRFIMIGFDKNPKAKYLQYEIELRNLQTAYFYLTGQPDVGLEMCKKNIKFLRNKNYTSINSDFPHYYEVVKALFDLNKGDSLNKKHQKMYERYQQSSYAVYGKILKQIRNSFSHLN